MAEHLGGELIVLDDGTGKRLARAKGVPRLSTAMLAAEMVAADAVTEPEGFAVYDIATPAHVGQREWLEALKRAQAAVASGREPPAGVVKTPA